MTVSSFGSYSLSDFQLYTFPEGGNGKKTQTLASKNRGILPETQGAPEAHRKLVTGCSMMG